MSRLKDQELQATLYFAVGESSESGDIACQLEIDISGLKRCNKMRFLLSSASR